MPTLQLSFWMFTASATGGATLLALALMDRHPPAWCGLAHGLLSLASLGTLALGLVLQGAMVSGQQVWAVAVLATTLAAGLFVRRINFPGRQPIPLAIVHGALAVLGLAALYKIAF
jgi:hypothetical protein